MPINGLNVGKDVSIVVNTPTGIKRFSYITGFHSNPVTGDLKSTGLDGRSRHAVVHEGWEGEIDFDRDGPTFDNFWAEIEDAYFTGKNQLSGTITETIQEPAGGISVFRYDNVTFKMKTMGDKKGNALIQGKLGFFAERRPKVS
jgi:hypothetical protein